MATDFQYDVSKLTSKIYSSRIFAFAPFRHLYNNSRAQRPFDNTERGRYKKGPQLVINFYGPRITSLKVALSISESLFSIERSNAVYGSAVKNA